MTCYTFILGTVFNVLQTQKLSFLKQCFISMDKLLFIKFNPHFHKAVYIQATVIELVNKIFTTNQDSVPLYLINLTVSNFDLLISKFKSTNLQNHINK